MDKKSLEYWVEREKKSEKRRNIIFVLSIIFCAYFAAYMFGNRFLYTTETCTVKDARVETIFSNGGGIIANDDILYVESEECPLITFRSTPEGEGSIAEFAQKIHVGETYKFRIGLVRLFPSDWIGMGIESL
ncbi:hypothetical protein ACN08Y_08345 [Rothia sp. P5764]|uniref:hypothetical protein n=1 Tax=Rothia sp. P5764 TaxID=3402654 RepID=UPI003ACC60B4